MKNKVFKKWTTLITVFAVMVALSSCETDKPLKTSIEDFQNPFDFVGIAHNDGLDYVINNFVLKESVAENEAQVIDLCNQFISTKSDNELIFNESIDYIAFGKQLINEINTYEKTGKRAKAFPDGSVEESYLLQLKNSLLCGSYNDANDCFNSIMILEKEIWESNLLDEDKYLLLTVSSVGKHSWKYWTENIDKIYPSNQFRKNPPNENLMALVEADFDGSIAGAICGGIFGAIYGSVIFPGVGTITAAIAEGIHGGVMGALVCSGIKGIRILIEELKKE